MRDSTRSAFAKPTSLFLHLKSCLLPHHKYCLYALPIEQSMVVSAWWYLWQWLFWFPNLFPNPTVVVGKTPILFLVVVHVVIELAHSYKYLGTLLDGSLWLAMSFSAEITFIFVWELDYGWQKLASFVPADISVKHSRDTGLWKSMELSFAEIA